MSPGRLTIFLSAGLSISEQRARNLDIARHIEVDYDVYLPQRDGGLLVDLVAGGMSWLDASRLISKRDRNALRDSNLVIAILEEPLVGAGVAFELGMAMAHGIPIWGLILGVERRSRSPLIESALDETFSGIDTLMTRLVGWPRRPPP